VHKHEHEGQRNRSVDLYITDREAWRRQYADWFAEQVDTAPPLTQSQRDRLAAIIGPNVAQTPTLGAAA
jgi:hypothetical protein